tara:strand:+ start:2720 stop:3175 length:456 start_codon:yes stop_codon:yes gene_type:complete
MVMSTDDNLLEYQADILDFGIDDFDAYHTKAREDILRKLRSEWWVRSRNMTNFDISRSLPSLEMDTTRLTESQFTRCAVYRVLSEYALPQLTKWNSDGDEDKFQIMMMHYRKKYDEEFTAILLDGVEYDYNNDNTVTESEKQPFHTRRMVR